MTFTQNYVWRDKYIKRYMEDGTQQHKTTEKEMEDFSIIHDWGENTPAYYLSSCDKIFFEEQFEHWRACLHLIKSSNLQKKNCPSHDKLTHT